MIRELKFIEKDNHFNESLNNQAVPFIRCISFEITIKVDPEDAPILRNRLLNALNSECKKESI